MDMNKELAIKAMYRSSLDTQTQDWIIKELDAYTRGKIDGLLAAADLVDTMPHLQRSRGIIYEVRKQLVRDLRDEANKLKGE